jgi:DNA-binding beta-propeller fold protein YncE
MNHDGSRVYAVGGAGGMVAEVDANQMQVLRTVPVRAGIDAAVLSADGKMLVAGGTSGLVWIDTSSLQAQKVSLSDWHVSSLALSPDGKTLFAVDDSGKVAEVAMSSGAVAATFDPAAGKPIALMRVAAA